MIARYLNKSVPNHIIYLFGFTGTLFGIFFRVFLNTRPTLAYILLSLGIACGLLVYFLHRQNSILKNSSSVYKSDNGEFSVARKDFIDTFDNALIRIHSQGQAVGGIFKETMSSHKVAFNKFRGTVERLKGSEAVDGLDKIWKKHCDVEKYGEGREFVKYRNRKSGTKEGEREARDCAIRNIQALLDFANKL